MTQRIKQASIKSNLSPTIYYYSEVGSTNSIARKMILEKNKFGFVVTSKVQTGGYGRRKNYWESPKGGLWCSIVIKPDIKVQSLGIVPILTALGVAQALQTFGIETKLKWPNDILYSQNNKKLGGILVEGKVSKRSLEYLIIGIGLNINNTLDQYSPSLKNIIKTTKILGIKL